MNIGLLAFGFAFVCGAVALIGSSAPDKQPERSEDYNKIYQAIRPKEI
jgi:hypothetical protein